MPLSTYTTVDNIRALLGVSDEELSDDVIELDVYDKALTLDLMDVASDFDTQYTTAKADQAVAANKRFVMVADMFASYSVAKQLCESLPNFAPRTISDGKAMQQRQQNAEDPVIKAVREGYLRYRTLLIDALNVLKAATVVTRAPVFMVTARGVDPVTNT